MTRKIKLLTGVAVAILATPAAAQTSAPADSQAQPAPDQDIVVTAQRRSERLQDVPISVAAFQGDQLKSRGALNTSDLGQLTTGVVIAETDASVQPYVRGLGSDTIILGEVGSVATYLDGVYMPDATGAVYDLANVESIEVLKGPQGTLFGRNTAGGAINIRTLPPQFTLQGNIEGTYGNYNHATVRGYVTGPISDKVAISLAGNYDRSDSYLFDLVRGARVDPSEQYTIRGSILFKPTERLELLLTLDNTRSKNPTAVAVSAVNGYAGQTPATLAPRGPYDYIGSVKPFLNITQRGVSLRAKYDFGGVTFTSLTAYRYNAADSGIEADRTPFVISDLYDHSPIKVFSQEAQLASNGSGPFTWLIGGYYSHQVAKYDPVTLIGSSVGGQLDIFNTAKSITYAVFANATYKIGPIELTGGLRFNRDEKSYFGGIGSAIFVPEGLVHHGWNSVTPRAVLSYHPNRNLLIYASYTGGFKSGAYNTTSFTTIPVKPETVKAYELGLKWTPAPIVTINGSLFLYDRKDVQVQSQDPINNLQQLANAARSRSKGAELEVNLRPVQGLALTMGATYLDAKYVSFPNALVYVPTPVPAGALPGSLGNTPISVDVSGQQVERSPKLTLTFSGSYKIRLADGGTITPSANLFYTDDYYFGRGARLHQPSYTLINAGIEWAMPKGISLSVWGRNLGNTVYYRNYVTNNFADSAIYAEPRTYGVTARYKF